jgi:NTP pyrophosphatase (non-canonical NTP hydrolase)
MARSPDESGGAGLTDGASGGTGFAIGSGTWPGISKLVEELGEVAQVAGKLIATGGEPGHWDGTDLRTRMEDELADLGAAIAFVIKRNGLDADRIAERREAKLRLFNAWHRQQGAGQP